MLRRSTPAPMEPTAEQRRILALESALAEAVQRIDWALAGAHRDVRSLQDALLDVRLILRG